MIKEHMWLLECKLCTGEWVQMTVPPYDTRKAAKDRAKRYRVEQGYTGRIRVAKYVRATPANDPPHVPEWEE